MSRSSGRSRLGEFVIDVSSLWRDHFVGIDFRSGLGEKLIQRERAKSSNGFDAAASATAELADQLEDIHLDAHLGPSQTA
jgi:hypothetical protein